MAQVNVIMQARMGSTRLPGKVVRKAGGKPMIGYLVERLMFAQNAARLIAVIPSRDLGSELDECLRAYGLDVIYGPEDDVAARFANALEAFPCDAFVRVCGDSPLLDPGLVDLAIAMFTDSPSLDLVTNTTPRTFPAGQCVELVKAKTFLDCEPRFSEPGDREHVTPYFYRHSASLKGAVFGMQPDMSDVRMVVDTEDDFQAFARAVANNPDHEVLRWQSFLHS